ncbi:hypothetical protein ACGLDM_004678 [Salmonella enterica subsp. enterica serovar Braenderup]|uniref:DUF7194 family protein n=1 Tax=Salmonella enterica TaxID=28901 RepID=UPI000FBEFE3C|nr:hypothetical protein [Salmonella enterica]EBU9919360.1 hypothetical protein [Salmonella enterica subsp. enterica serovar Weybridge]EBZ7571605.1 hypothetical protein [Salmonella enterica subsp. enterica serovar Infantis]ECE0087215.1 hypothetical protein [Salmonella enterica subsp. enterica serovar Poona]EED6472056.1 hypothetical protein [Salmonella enterica subsp. enterica serovar Derby]MKP52348.1 hypothetical protein [Salmonella enterica subsp. enterica serovar Javiana]ULF48437.1 hypotheti
MAQLLPNTPQVNLEGLFKVKAPYTLPDKVIYRVDAVQNFPKLQRNNIDVYNKYYKPVGLTRDDYISDANVEASIVTLKSRDGQVYELPDTYIETYPGLNGLNYRRNVVVIDLALIPEYVDVTLLTNDLKSVLERGLGIDARVDITSMDYEGTVTEEEHLRMEAVRKAKIREQVPLAEQVATLTKQNQELQALNDAMLKILKDNGLTN